MSLLDALLLESPIPTSPLTGPADIWLALRTDGIKGSGNQADPFDGGTQPKFDALMSSFTQDNLTIHIGPGVFETKGNGAFALGVGWSIRKGWKILGSGMDVTTLKVVGATVPQVHLAVGPHAFDPFADYAEVSDLTVDCNMADSPGSATAAIDLRGSHTRIRRVKAIGWGTEAAGVECFVMSIGGADPDKGEPADCIIEDCICIQPHEHNRAVVSVIHAVGADSSIDHRLAYNTSPVFRRNFVDCAFPNGRSSFVLGVKTLNRLASSTVATCETHRKHGRSTLDRVLILICFQDDCNGVMVCGWEDQFALM